MMQIAKAATLIVLVAIIVGCRSMQPPAWYADTWRGFPYQYAREYLGQYRNVVLVRITADHGEQSEIDIGGTKRNGGYVHHFKATVVRSYKGDCRDTDQVAFAKGYCPCGGSRQATTNSSVGQLEFLLVENAIRPNVEFGIDPSNADRYDEATDRLFNYILKNCDNMEERSPRGVRK